ncbi:hypothetical protein N0V90_005282 [Kalmusia sp. IMI 367209]|nr:hypothetical protein N0V90_005282 [Kalmusia sp. IMI 367209]
MGSSVHAKDDMSYWRDALVDSDHVPYPPLPFSVQKPTINAFVDHEVSLLPTDLSTVSTTVLVRAAWALVAGRMSNLEDVVFGIVASNKALSDALSDASGGMHEPNTDVFPSRVQWASDWTVPRYLNSVNQGAKDVEPFETTGLERIAGSCAGAEQACSFQTVLEIQSEKGRIGQELHEHWRMDNIALYLHMLSQPDSIKVEASFDKRVIDSWMVRKLISHFELVLGQLRKASPETTIADLEMVTEMDLVATWERNRELPPPIQRCIHKIFEQQAQAYPEAIALQAWDGEMSYRELDRLSTMLAGNLFQYGIGADALVPLCFEKSMWAVVALLGILKSGAAFVLLDPSLPVQRLATIIEKTRSKIVISSTTCFEVVADYAEKTVVVGVELFKDLSHQPPQKLDEISSESLMYVVFTSGSTGTPKGAMITHQNFASAMFYEAESYRLDRRSRIYDFASYGFIVSIVNMFNALCSGACICIPREEDKRNRLVESINSLRANIIHLTPSTAKLLSPEEVPGIRTVVFSGEGLHADDLKKWWGKVYVLNVYGQSECAPRATINDSATTPAEATRIGRGLGQKTWIVDPQNYNRLVPIGCVGELLLEGPQVGRGYLEDSENTTSSFIKDPVWLLSGPREGLGRSGRLYKTGDLVQSTRDGTLTLVGRKDAQVKIRGQRVELGEVEHRVLECIDEAKQVVAEVFMPRGDSENPVLAAFLLLGGTASRKVHEKNGFHTAEIYHITTETLSRLHDSLPSYMIPSVYLSVAEIPRTATNKIDRRQLRDIGASYSAQQLAEMRTSASGPKESPNQPMEKQIQALWSRVLNLNSSFIGLGDSFIELGGESITAMRVVSEGRRMGIDLSVATILTSSTLKEVADRSSYIEQVTFEAIEPYSLLKSGARLPLLLEETAALCGTYQEAILDIYPCTPLQEGLFSLALASKQGDYVAQFTLDISDHINVDRLCEAWGQVIERTPILRTRIVANHNEGLLQVVLDEKVHWITTSGLDQYLKADRELRMGIGQPLSRYALIKDHKGSIKWLTWTLHHALYDGWSFPILLKALNDAYSGVTLKEHPPFNRFIKYISDMDVDAASNYWRDLLMDYDNAPFPTLPPSVKQPLTNTILEHQVDLTGHQNSSANITLSTLIRAAWGLVMGNITSTNDVVFGMPVSGRAAPVSGIELMTGPTLATVPVRVKWEADHKLTDFLEVVHHQAIEMMPFEQIGLGRISESGPGGERACAFQTLILIHPDIKTAKNDLLGEWSGVRERESTYALMLEIQMHITGFTITASFDSRIIKPWVVRMLLERLEHVSTQLRFADAEALVGDVEPMTQRDLDTIWGWNHDLPEPVNDLMHKIIQRHAITTPNSLAICAWDGDLTYSQLDQESTKLAWRLVDEGVEPDQIVPLCFEKSMWTPVAMLGVLKAGGGFVLLDAALPEQRLATIVQQVSPRVMLSSHMNLPLATRLTSNVIRVDNEFFINALEQPGRILTDHSPESLMYIVFTSGSTGTPKGVMLSHKNFASAVRHQEKYYREEGQSRVYDFASYSFDVAVLNVFNTLALGGCLCVPSDQERKDNLAESINSFRATLLDITPSLSRLLIPEELPSLKKIILGGEALLQRDADLWRGKVEMLNSYGPSECTPNATMNEDMSTLEEALSIGKGAGQVTWIVDPDNHDVLIAPGCVGELLLEGPLVGRGYLNEPGKTAAVFVDNPSWLLKGSLGRPGRQGRLYKTGDLVQYTENGALTFLGRKDMQVKIRGQRVELGEIELRIHESIDLVEHAVAEVIVPSGKGARPTLAAFICIKDTNSKDEEESRSAKIFPIEPEVQNKLHERLPIYMVPSVFFKLPELPMTPSGKINRKQLREIGASFTVMELAEIRTAENSDKRQPHSKEEKALQQLWSQILGIELDAIGLGDDFFQLGGDSIAIMKMVATARNQGIEIQVADVFLRPSLEQLASGLKSRSTPLEAPIAPFDLLEINTDQDLVRHDIAAIYNWDPSDILDIYPCTPLQEGLLSLSSKQPGDYIWQQTLELSPDISVDAFRSAWEKVFQESEILRTRIVQDSALGSLQIVLDEDIQWIESSDLEEYQHLDRTQTMEPGNRLVRYALIKDEDGVVKWFVWTIHHALYDGWSMPLILKAVDLACQGSSFDASLRFNRFIKYVNNIDGEKSKIYWKRALEDFDDAPFPLLTQTITQAVADETTHVTIKLPQLRASNFTVAILVRAAWALSTGHWTNSKDVVFGATVSGRNAPVTGIETLMAPTIATVPVRIKWSDHWRVSDFMEMVNQQNVDMIPFEQTGLRRIAKLCAGSKQACQFQTLLAVQPKDASSESDSLGKWQEISYSWSGTYALELLAQLDTDSIKLEASFDARLIKPWYLKKLIHHFSATLQQLASGDPSAKISELNRIAEDDLDTIWRWNHAVSQSDERLVQFEGADEIPWVVDAGDYNRLAPVGSVGELLIEGGSQREFNGRPGESYIQDPEWLLSGRPGRPGRHGNLYRTGDLVRYDEDGSLVFISRKDIEVKIHGQPVDLPEVERCVQKSIPEAKQVIAEVILPVGEGARSTLAIFIPKNLFTPIGSNARTEKPIAQVRPIDSKVEDELVRALPRHMVPTVFLSVEALPVTLSGQVDRKLLREIGGSLSVHELAEKRSDAQGTKRQPTTDMEKRIQRFWSQVLNVDLGSIGLDDNFFHLGGDSIEGMRMVSVAGRDGVKLMLTDLFRHPKLEDVASKASYVNSDKSHDIIPFSLLQRNVDRENLMDAAAISCDISKALIEDIYPCTPLQEGLLSLSSKNGDYVTQFTLKISDEVDLLRFRKSWEEMFQRAAILRTRIIVDEMNDRLLQVVLDEQMKWTMASDLSNYLVSDRNQAMTIGKPLARFALISEVTGSEWLVLTVHHALYDGWSLPLMIDQASKIYQGRKLEPCLSFNRFIQYVISQDNNSATEYWQSSLKGCHHVPFPALPASVREPAAHQSARQRILLSKGVLSDITTSTLAHAAWSLVIGRMIGTEEVVFGTTISGRSASVTGIDEIVGPTIATVPMRVMWSRTSTIKEFLDALQHQRTEMIPFEQTGLHRIAKLNTDCATACQFNTLLIIQPQERERQENVFGIWQDDEGQKTNTYPLTLFIELGESEVFVKASFDSRVIEPLTMTRLLEQFEATICELHVNSENHSKTLRELAQVPLNDLRALWKENSVVPQPINTLIHATVEEQARTRPTAPAIHAWDGDLSYEELDRLSTTLSIYLVELGVAPGVVIPLCFEKSKWVIVSLFGVLKAGGAFVLLDTSLPEQRLKSIVQQFEGNLVLSSSTYQRDGISLSETIVVVDAELLKNIAKTSSSSTPVLLSPESVAYVVFTSGSTGIPKGVQVSHRNLVSAIHYQRVHFKYSESSRFLDFASYSFDMALFTIFHNFAAGACLCIPRDEDRKNNLSKTISSLKADTLVLTPSVSRSIRPEDVPGVRSILWCGEALHSKDAEPWFTKTHSINTYGPSECTPVTTINYNPKNVEEMGYIGHGVGVVTWVVDPEDYNHLVPIGHVGELLLEGPLVGLGYLKKPKETSKSFIHDPSWLVEGFEEHLGRNGRLYRTGDLVRYTSDGNLVFVGRRNTKVKVRGQWVELGDVGYQVAEHLPGVKQVVAEVIAPGGDETRPLLAAFVQQGESGQNPGTSESASILKVYHMDAQAEVALSESLPKHMMPDVYFSVTQIPMTAAGKTNRARLRELGATLTIQELADLRTAGQGPKRLPSTAAEIQMQLIWSHVLQVETDTIGLDDNFFQLGGDSIGAMKLVGAARKEGIVLTMANIFHNPRLEQLARLGSLDEDDFKSFTGSDEDEIIASTQKLELLAELDSLNLNSNTSEVAEILPLTDFQYNLVKASMSNPPLFCNYFYLDLDVSPDINQLESACTWTLERLPILRSRFLPIQGSFWQVIPQQVQVALQVIDVSEDLDTFSAEFCSRNSESIKVTDAPFAVLLFRDKENKARLVLRMSHAQYDGISWVQIFTAILQGRQDTLPPPASLFTNYLIYAHKRRTSSREYWTRLLKSSTITQIWDYLPQLPSLSSPREAIRLERDISLPQLPMGITTAALLSSAWAALLFVLTGKDDIVYSQLVAGRNAAIDGVEDIVGPCVNIIPIRASPSALQTPKSLLHSIQDQFFTVGDADSLGLRDIQEHCTDWPANSVIDSVVVHQNIDESPSFESNGSTSNLQSFPNPHHIQSKIWVTSRPRGNKVNIEFQANTHLMTSATADAILSKYCQLATTLFRDLDTPLELSSEPFKIENMETDFVSYPGFAVVAP